MSVFPIAGELKDQGGGYLDAKWERLKTLKSTPDSEREGVRLEINGGWKQSDDGKRSQKAIIEFICDKTRVGNEHLWNPEDKYEEGVEERDVKEKEGEADDTTSPSLQYVSYDTTGKDADLLRLLWRTKFACEDAKQEKDAERKTRWGFFTWFIIM